MPGLHRLVGEIANSTASRIHTFDRTHCFDPDNYRYKAQSMEFALSLTILSHGSWKERSISLLIKVNFLSYVKSLNSMNKVPLSNLQDTTSADKYLQGRLTSANAQYIAGLRFEQIMKKILAEAIISH